MTGVLYAPVTASRYSELRNADGPIGDQEISLHRVLEL
jgi:hypothetical protein